MWKFSANTAGSVQLIAIWMSRLMNSWTGGRSIRHLVKPITMSHHQQWSLIEPSTSGNGLWNCTSSDRLPWSPMAIPGPSNSSMIASLMVLAIQWQSMNVLAMYRREWARHSGTNARRSWWMGGVGRWGWRGRGSSLTRTSRSSLSTLVRPLGPTWWLSCNERCCMGIFYHSQSTDSMPQHQFCLNGQRSWCKYNCALAEVRATTTQLTHHPSRHAPHLFKIFERLSKDIMMEGCVLGATPNQNEQFNSTIWQRCPKTEFCSATIVEIVVNLAVIFFNPLQLSRNGSGSQFLHFPCSTFLPRTITGCLHQWWRQKCRWRRGRLCIWTGWHWRSSKWRKRGRRMVLGNFEGVFKINFILPAFFKATTYQRASLSVCVCVCGMCVSVGKQLATAFS